MATASGISSFTVVPKDGKGKLEPLHVLSIAGRALFFRFLIDRRIVLNGEIQEICPDADNLVMIN